MPLPKKDYLTALQGPKRFTDHQIELIHEWHCRPKAKITAKQIAKLFGYADGKRSNIDMGNIAKIVLNNLGLPEDDYRNNDESWLWNAICDEYDNGWIMAKDFMEALEEAGIVSKDERHFEREPMRQDLPELDDTLLEKILLSINDFSYLTGQEPQQLQDEEPKTIALVKILIEMGLFNYHHRHNDRMRLFGELDAIIGFDYNTEATAIWLGMLLAIQELYGLTDAKLLSVVRRMFK